MSWFSMEGLSSIIGAASSGAANIIAATKGNVRATTTNVGIGTPAVGSSPAASTAGLLVVGFLVFLGFRLLGKKRRR